MGVVPKLLFHFMKPLIFLKSFSFKNKKYYRIAYFAYFKYFKLYSSNLYILNILRVKYPDFLTKLEALGLSGSLIVKSISNNIENNEFSKTLTKFYFFKK